MGCEEPRCLEIHTCDVISLPNYTFLGFAAWLGNAGCATILI